MRLVAEYNSIKSHPAFPQKFNCTVKPETLKSIKLYSSYILRPLENKNNNGLFFGVILKLPTVDLVSQFAEGEEWKAALVKKEKGPQVGDKVVYLGKTDITLDGERLDYVSYIEGIVCEDKEI